jgi:glycerol-3-phosphate acyltransferase PlsY
VLPVVLSVLVIVVVAVVQERSRHLAAIIATVPLTAPLAMWIVFCYVWLPFMIIPVYAASANVRHAANGQRTATTVCNPDSRQYALCQRR